MTTERIKEIQSETAYPDSVSVQQALMKVWNECKQEQLRLHNVSTRFWSVVEKRGQVYHELKSYKRKQDAVALLVKLKSESLTDYQLVSISNGC